LAFFVSAMAYKKKAGLRFLAKGKTRRKKVNNGARFFKRVSAFLISPKILRMSSDFFAPK